MYSDIYDKRTNFTFPGNKFTHIKSCLHISVCKNIILNHSFRIKQSLFSEI